MAVTIKTLFRGYAPTATIYTANNCSAIIDKFTVTNTEVSGGDIATLSVFLVEVNKEPGNLNRIISQRKIVPGETYLCPEIVGQALMPGDYISINATANLLTISATGREVT